jgi:hypothetical protein
MNVKLKKERPKIIMKKNQRRKKIMRRKKKVKVKNRRND